MKKVKFLEEVDYKMDVEDGETKQREVRVVSGEPLSEEKCIAFKKKLRRFSNMDIEGSYEELP